MTLGTPICESFATESPSKKDPKMKQRVGIVPKKLLNEAVYTKNIDKFKEAIRLGASVNDLFDESGRTVYELVLSTFGYSKFVKACLNTGCDVNYVSSKINQYSLYNFIVSEKLEAW